MALRENFYYQEQSSMAMWRHFFRFWQQMRYQENFLEEISKLLGLELNSAITFDEWILILSSSHAPSTALCKFMPRTDAETVFEQAQRREKFKQSSLFSYYFKEGWLEFSLHFDDNDRLRRIYLHHKTIKRERGIELRLEGGSRVRNSTRANDANAHEVELSSGGIKSAASLKPNSLGGCIGMVESNSFY